MSSQETASIVYLVALLVLTAAGLMAMGRGRGLQMVRQAAAWVLIFVLFGAAYSIWESQPKTAALPRVIELRGTGAVEIPRAWDGHYYATLHLNGVPVEFVVDTGASDIVLTRQDAEKVGLNPDSLDFTGRAFSANGEVRTAPARVDSVIMGPFTDRNVRVSVNGGEMFGSLLGMAYLNRFDRMSFEDEKLVLSRD